MTEHITPRQFHADPSLAEGRVIGDGACTVFHTRSFVESARLVQAISELPGLENHTPDVDLRQDGVTIRLITITDDYYGHEPA
jgi:4a-hydroxytetrahydrobiopterin dehydratase